MNKFFDRIAMIATRMAITIFWLIVIALFLFLPKVTSFFTSTKSITVFTFPRLIDAQVVAQFERETGIKVYISYYENNDELLVKMRQTRGEGYDLIIPSDYAVDTLRKESLLQKIDTTKLDFVSNIFPELRNLYSDPTNEYSVPYFWGIYGIGFNKNYFKDKPFPSSWGAIFDKNKIFYRVGMVNNPREAVNLAALYLFGSVDTLDLAQQKEVLQLLVAQKKWVQSYTDLAPDYLLLSGSSPVVASLNNEIWQARMHNPMLDFVVPREGSFVVVDSMVIPMASSKQDMVYQFMNFLYTPRVLLHHVAKFSLLPARGDGELAARQEAALINVFVNNPGTIYFFKNIISESALHDVWLKLKAS